MWHLFTSDARHSRDFGHSLVQRYPLQAHPSLRRTHNHGLRAIPMGPRGALEFHETASSACTAFFVVVQRNATSSARIKAEYHFLAIHVNKSEASSRCGSCRSRFCSRRHSSVTNATLSRMQSSKIQVGLA